jgi:hypothetical protein
VPEFRGVLVLEDCERENAYQVRNVVQPSYSVYSPQFDSTILEAHVASTSLPKHSMPGAKIFCERKRRHNITSSASAPSMQSYTTLGISPWNQH